MPLKIWDQHSDWEEAEASWDSKAAKAAAKQPIKKLKNLPQMPGIVPETAKGLKWKSLKYMIGADHGRKITKHFLKHPIRYGARFFRSFLKKKAYVRQDDFFFYGLSSTEEFLKKAQDALIVVGFSYCQKPFECPSGRFTDRCIRDANNPVCQQCDIGKVMHALPDQIIPLIIPTVHYIGDQIFKIVHAYPKRKVLFLITACEMTLEMFGDYGKMAGVEGIGVRLDGRICNTMRAFELSERGIKPGLTVVTKSTQAQILDLVRQIRTDCASA